MGDTDFPVTRLTIPASLKYSIFDERASVIFILLTRAGLLPVCGPFREERGEIPDSNGYSLTISTDADDRLPDPAPYLTPLPL